MTEQNKNESQQSAVNPQRLEANLASKNNFFSEIGNSLSETLISWQLPYESDIFKILNVKRKFDKFEDDERVYFKYYVTTFRMEILSGLTTLPMGVLAYKYKMEMNKPIKDVTKVNKYLKLLFIAGIPSINLFLVTFYRRYFYKHQYEDQLKLKYIKEIRESKTKASAQENKK